MSHIVQVKTSRRITTQVPAHEVENYLINGWSLTDESDCSGARMIPPALPREIPPRSGK